MSDDQPLPGIEHVIVLMLENRSFDNVLGGLYPRLTSQGLYRGLRGTETNPLDPGNPMRGSVKVFQGKDEVSTWTMPYPDPGELYMDMVEQIFGTSQVPPGGIPATMSGFAWNYGKQPQSPDRKAPIPRHIMQYYSNAMMPVSTYLATQYAVCDYWFAAGPVQTLANRVFTHCGTPGKLPEVNKSRVNNPDYTKDLAGSFEPSVADTTIFQLLDAAYPEGMAPRCSDLHDPTLCLTWKVYYHDAPLSALCKYVFDHWCLDDLYGGNVWGFESSTLDPGFEHDVENGLLPKYSFIEPRYSDANRTSPGPVNSNHPGGSGIDWENPNGSSLPPAVDVRHGEELLYKLYSILNKYPKIFEKTLLIVTYDEHGGLYDHVGPGRAVSPFQTPVQNFNYDRYGVRVPAILINPSIKPGTVYPAREKLDGRVPDLPFDHTSILSTLIAQFRLRASLSPRVDKAPLLKGLVPKIRVHYDRPPLVYPAVATEIQTPRQTEPRSLPEAHSLAGALGPLYQLIKKSKRNSRR